MADQTPSTPETDAPTQHPIDAAIDRFCENVRPANDRASAVSFVEITVTKTALREQARQLARDVFDYCNDTAAAHQAVLEKEIALLNDKISNLLAAKPAAPAAAADPAPPTTAPQGEPHA